MGLALVAALVAAAWFGPEVTGRYGFYQQALIFIPIFSLRRAEVTVCHREVKRRVQVLGSLCRSLPWVVGIVLAVFAVLIVANPFRDLTATSIALMGVGALIECWFRVTCSLTTYHKDLANLSKARLIQGLFLLVMPFPLAKVIAPLEALILADFVGRFVAGFMVFHKQTRAEWRMGWIRWRSKRGLNVVKAGDLRDDLLVTVSQTATALLASLPLNIANVFFGPREAGLVSLSMRLTSGLVQLIGKTVTQVFNPMIARAVESSREHRATMFGKMRLFSVAMAFGLVAIGLVASVGIYFLNSKPEWRGIEMVLPWMAVFHGSILYAYAFVSIPLLFGQPKLQAKLEIGVFSFAAIAVAIVLVATWQMSAVLIAFAIASVIGNTLLVERSIRCGLSG